MNTVTPQSGLALAARYAVPFVLLLIPIWRSLVNKTVPDPYLDEAFHVPQAQAYWSHNWTHWDPHITTPPGLYLWSYAVCAVVRFLRGSPTELTPEALRATNVVAAAVFLPWRLQTLLDTIRKQRNTRQLGAWLSHTVLNICLFPPLFFFSGLYYTDILALLVVIEAYNWDLKRVSNSGSTFLPTLVFLVLGLAALAFRQTNIFWVAVFLGGLQVVRKLRSSSKPCESKALGTIATRAFKNELYDPLVSNASFADYVKASISLAAVALRNLPQVIATLIPYFVILAAFGTFVLWNNGVVLGHKEFHTAGLHLPQMLYIWPYFLFFSWPIAFIPVINVLLSKNWLPKSLDYGFPARQKGLPGIITALVVMPIMAAVVHYNTVVHPFTLADNRHYIFYVFRILLRYHPAVKYVAVIAYFLCGWIILSAFGFSTVPQAPKLVPAPQAPQQTAHQSAHDAQKKTPTADKKITSRKAKSPKKTPPQPPKAPPVSPETIAKVQEAIVQRQRQDQGASRVSFVLVWLAATSLSLVTAPLVEPRYFIIPWVIWRLHLPPQPKPVVYRLQRPRDAKEDLDEKIATNLPLFFETYWFLFVNAVTGYIFLYNGFTWPQEPGKIQRFLW